MKLYVSHRTLCEGSFALRDFQVGEYVVSLLTRARELSNEIYLKACAATFREAWRIVDAVIEISNERSDAVVSRNRAEDVV